MLVEKMSNQRHEVFGPVAKRRYVNVDNVDPIQQVMAQPPVSHHRVEVAVRGRHHSDVDGHGCVGAKGMDFLFL